MLWEDFKESSLSFKKIPGVPENRNMSDRASKALSDRKFYSSWNNFEVG